MNSACNKTWHLPVGKEFGETEVRQFQVTLSVYEQVLWLQIPVHYTPYVQVVQCRHDFRGVKVGGVHGETTSVS